MKLGQEKVKDQSKIRHMGNSHLGDKRKPTISLMLLTLTDLYLPIKAEDLGRIEIQNASMFQSHRNKNPHHIQKHLRD